MFDTFFISEISIILNQYVTENSITGNSRIDQRLITISIGIISLLIFYLRSFFKTILASFYNKYILYFTDYNKWLIESDEYVSVISTFYGYEGLLPDRNSTYSKMDHYFDDGYYDKDSLLSAHFKYLTVEFYQDFWHLRDMGDKNISLDDEDSEQFKNRHIVKHFNPIGIDVDDNDSDIFDNFDINIKQTANKMENCDKLPKTVLIHCYKSKRADRGLTLKMYFNIGYKSNKIKSQILKSFLNQFSTKKKLGIYEISKNTWGQVDSIPDNINVVGKNARSIINDVNKFINDYSSIYKKAGIPYKRGYLLHGPPGTGKTSIVKKIALETHRKIYRITFNEDNMTSSSFKDKISSINEPGIILFDDIDPNILGENFIPKYTEVITEKDIDTRNEKYGETTKDVRVRKSVGPIITYDTLLQIFDTINSNFGHIYFIITNTPGKIGKSLIRPGRIDFIKEITYMDKQEVVEYFKITYSLFEIKHDDLTDYGIKFYDKYISIYKNITGAELQSYVIKYLDRLENLYEDIEILKYDRMKISEE